MRFVPAERQNEKIPCRHVPLDAAGQTLNTLYAYGTQLEIEEASESWLKTTIHRLEQVRSNADRASIQILGDDSEAFLIYQWF
jgi:nitrate/nitrite-specific signal transduction histidine kinase